MNLLGTIHLYMRLNLTNNDLFRDYFIRVRNRIQYIHTLYNLASFPDVICETQEAFELLLRGYLRLHKIDPPKWHDVGSILVNNQNLLGIEINKNIDKIVFFSKYLRRERDNAFYGDDDLIPLATYTEEEAKSCLSKLEFFTSFFEKEF